MDWRNSKSCLLVDTIPKNARNMGSVNLGLEIVADRLGADVIDWWEVADKEYDVIAFNVFYVTHLLNIYPFLKNNGISLFAKDRRGSPYVIAGGQGIGGNGILDTVCDEVFVGEFDGDSMDKDGFHRVGELDSCPIVKNSKAVIELTRGCKYRCTFCEYGWVHGGKYREKDLEFVKEQISQCLDVGIRQINFLSANFGGYGKIEELLDFCKEKKVSVLNSDTCLRDMMRLTPHIKSNYVKLGVESFDEKTRFSVGKKIKDDELREMFDHLVSQGASGIHFYLIYGLPGDDYDRWYDWLEWLAARREACTDRNLRLEFNITNFEPCAGTPLENAPQVDFEQKHIFLKKWADMLVRLVYHREDEIWYHNCWGRFGRREASYKLLMALKTWGPEAAERFKRFPHGVGRSVNENVAMKFFNKGEI